ncbi:MAG: phosphonopyruvate decarboxylase [Butyrivibrio sp.]|nr:phosphonopyruvate decarboxylase [Butyrivibrio sp.]
MRVEVFLEMIKSDFYTGVPDSQLKALCDYLIDTYGINPEHHVIAANEGNCVALAAGYSLATGKRPVVYMQNSGEGNAVNPIVSLISDRVYAIPIQFVIGWRGEPGIHDEPQHVFQGEITCDLLDKLGIKYTIITKDTTCDDLLEIVSEFDEFMDCGKSVAYIIKKEALTYDKKVRYENDNLVKREDIIEHILQVSGDDPIVATTGKTSRELFELREKNGQMHDLDFLTVGSMGHASSFALGIAINKPNRKVWCIDGDGAMIMHLGATAVIGSIHPNNMVHVLINNGAHESVGGMPTVASSVNIIELAKACGYQYVTSVNDLKSLDRELESVCERKCLSFIEVKCAIGSRSDLGRPTTSPKENKDCFINYLKRI